ncbi:unnamed protein product [Diplocarpon coronariae]|uniref:UBC core domain-containing protein n=1 Tax=Diplocarpon coronariae TaxID=2795749 RepID=A0A218Z6Y6_9HELO|nr:hypothetical protein B2J93_3025 [Marssonina coronariae]
MSSWKVIIQGPPESAYTAGTFAMSLDMEERYPAFPPKCRFTTPIQEDGVQDDPFTGATSLGGAVLKFCAVLFGLVETESVW